MNGIAPAIDVHGHYGRYDRDAMHPLVCEWMSATAEQVQQRASACGITCTIVSPLTALMPRFKGRAFEGNIEAAQAVEKIEGLRQWVVVDPRDPRTYDQADQLLKTPRCVGIKVHPEEHGYPITEFGDAIFGFAAERGAVVLTHSGEANSLPGDFVGLLNTHRDATLILAHLGHGPNEDPTHQVRAIQASRHGNLYTDTSSARSVLPGLIEWAVREVGADRILFGSDTPLYHTANQKARILASDLTDADKQRLLWKNAARLIAGLSQFRPDTDSPVGSVSSGDAEEMRLTDTPPMGRLDE